MEINFETDHFYSEAIDFQDAFLDTRGMDKKEKIAREALVKKWKEIFRYFAQAGVPIPPMHEIRKILEREGVQAATDAVSEKYWYLPRKSIEKEVKKQVREALRNPELDAFVEEVKRAQTDPSLLPGLERYIEDYVMGRI